MKPVIKSVFPGAWNSSCEKVLPAIEDSSTNSLPDLSEANVSLKGKSVSEFKE